LINAIYLQVQEGQLQGKFIRALIYILHNHAGFGVLLFCWRPSTWYIGSLVLYTL